MPKPMTRNEFLQYLDYFNSKSYENIVSYFADDCEFIYATEWTLEPQVKKSFKGKDAFIEHYKEVHETFNETIKLGAFMSTEDTIIAEVFTLFEAEKEGDIRAGHFMPGEKFYMNQYIDYSLDENGKFTLVRIAQFQTLDPATA